MSLAAEVRYVLVVRSEVLVLRSRTRASRSHFRNTKAPFVKMYTALCFSMVRSDMSLHVALRLVRLVDSKLLHYFCVAISIQAGSPLTDGYACPNKQPDNTIAWPGQHCTDPGGQIRDEAQCVSAGYTWGNYLCGNMHEYFRARWNDGSLILAKPLYSTNCCGDTSQACICFLLVHHQGSD